MTSSCGLDVKFVSYGTPSREIVQIAKDFAADRVKLLAWDGSGMVLVTKWLLQGRFTWPPMSADIGPRGQSVGQAAQFCLASSASRHCQPSVSANTLAAPEAVLRASSPQRCRKDAM
jgi:hypothetical protein